MITGEWNNALSSEFKKEYYKKLYLFVKEEYSKKLIYPKATQIYTALELTKLSDIRVVLLGQDPYHEENQAMGLSFSVPKNQSVLPPSLKNIYKEIEDDLGIKMQKTGDLSYLARQGVLLLNSTLTVEAHRANSHKGKGWESLTDAIIKKVAKENRPLVFLLWGRSAQDKESFIENPKHLVLKAPHPSPLSAHRGFFGCKHFSKTNEFLIKNGIMPIKWNEE